MQKSSISLTIASCLTSCRSLVILISKNIATRQLSESIAYCLLPVAFYNRSVAILNSIGITITALNNPLK